ncbi:hypothetical protein [Ornithinimicrobium avium]|nr:hypothetical protein [Ornithinimicrobium avium]
MDSTRIRRAAVAAALVSFVFFGVKDLVMAAAGGVGRTWWENPPFYIAFVLALVSLVLTGLVACRGRTWIARLGLVLVMLLFCAAAAGVGVLVVGVVQPADPGWIWGELNLFMLPLSALALALVLPRWPVAQLPGRAGTGRGAAGTLGV